MTAMTRPSGTIRDHQGPDHKMSDVFRCQVPGLKFFQRFFRSGILKVPEGLPALTHGSVAVAWWPDVARTKQPARYGGRACDGNASQEEECFVPDPWIKRLRSTEIWETVMKK